MSVRSNKADLLSAKSSVALSREEKEKNKRAKARGTLPRDSNTKLKLQEYQDIALPDEEIKVKSNPSVLRKVSIRGSLFRTLNNAGAFLLSGPMTNSSSSSPVSGVSCLRKRGRERKGGAGRKGGRREVRETLRIEPETLQCVSQHSNH